MTNPTTPLEALSEAMTDADDSDEGLAELRAALALVDRAIDLYRAAFDAGHAFMAKDDRIEVREAALTDIYRERVALADTEPKP